MAQQLHSWEETKITECIYQQKDLFKDVYNRIILIFSAKNYNFIITKI